VYRLHFNAETFISMYDYPVCGSYEFEEERAVFCTFVMINHQITHLVRWSKKRVQEESAPLIEHYSVSAQLWNKTFPFWTVKMLQEFYASKDSVHPKKLYRKIVLEDYVFPTKAILLWNQEYAF
jgi:hypothetical protein